jgi:hypothetical protein
MSALLWLVGTRAGQGVAAVVAALAALGAALLAARGIGRRDAERRTLGADLEARDVRDAIDRGIAREPDPSGRLLDKWSRD